MKKTLLLVFLNLIIFTNNNYAQAKFPILIQQNLENYILNQYPEKTYVQTDKPVYTIGEDIWFSAYLINGITHRRTPKSRILYVELINPDDKIIDKKTLYVHDVNVAGDFKIDEDWQEGNYTLRAYTNYMRNDSTSFFQKDIPIYNFNKDETQTNPTDAVVADSTLKQTTTITTPEVSFYPEGGYLVSGLQNKVAFKTKEKTNFIASLKDQDNNEIATIKNIDLGLGVFSITPEKDKTYHISTLVNEQEYTYNLPKALPQGYVISATNTSKHIVVNVNSNMPNGLQNCYLIAHQRGILFHQDYETENIHNKTINIPTSYLTDGVVNITLFNADGHPVTERVVFVDNPTNNLKLAINTDKNTYKSREKVNVDVHLTDINGGSEISNLSMAVRDLKAFPYNTRTHNIKTYLLLNSDLRGAVDQPGYFFEKENDAKRKYLLDLVMMTHGWKRFTWQGLLQNNKQQYKPETSLYITGTTTKLKKKDKPHASEVKLTFLGNVFAQEPIQKTGESGRFKFGPYTFMDSISTIIEARYDHFGSTSLKTKNVQIILDEPQPSPIVINNKNNNTKTSISKKESSFVKVAQYVQQVKFEYNQEAERLKAVELKATLATAEEKRKKEMENRTFYRRPDNMMNRIDVSNLDFVPTTIIDLLNTNATHVIREELDNFYWNRNNSIVNIMLDSRPIDMNILRGITCDEISFVDIITGSARSLFTQTGSDNNSGSIIALYSKKGHEYKKGKKVIKPGVINFKAKGFYTAREFFAPDHINGFEEQNQTDIRTTLHWEPLIKTTKEAPSKILFFTGDIKSDYIIEIEGISDKGQPIHAIKTFNVE